MQLKEKLIAEIEQINDEELLNQLLRMINLESKADEIYHLNADEINAVNEGIAQLDQGRFISNEEVDRQALECLNK